MPFIASVFNALLGLAIITGLVYATHYAFRRRARMLGCLCGIFALVACGGWIRTHGTIMVFILAGLMVMIAGLSILGLRVYRRRVVHPHGTPWSFRNSRPQDGRMQTTPRSRTVHIPDIVSSSDLPPRD